MRSLPSQRQPRKTIRRRYTHDNDLKIWNPCFFKRRKLPTKCSLIETWREYDTTGDPLDILLRDIGDQTPSWVIELVKEFCLRSSVFQSNGRAVHARARVCEPETPSGLQRIHGDWLSPERLREVLGKEESCTEDTQSNAGLRLIYIYHLDRDYVLSLAETVSWDVVDAVRDAIWKHIAFETSIRVHIPLSGYTTFRLEFHLPYLILRAASGTTEVSCPDSFTKEQFSWEDLGFLNLKPNEQGESGYTVRKAHISLVVTGYNHYNWTGYAFANTGVGDLVFDEDDEFDVAEEGDEAPDLDYFPSDGQGEVLTTENLIKDPRSYWLCAVGLRLSIVLKEWTYLVHKIEDGLHRWQAKEQSAVGGLNGTNPDLMKDLMNRTVRTCQFLGTISGLISVSLEAWNGFIALDGDISYFHDITDQKARLTLNSIKESFTTLARLDKKMRTLSQSIKDFEKELARYMDLENIRLNFESNELMRKAHVLNLQTNVLSRDIHYLNRTSTEVAVENMETAKKTSLTARDNIQLLWITTPFILVLQYFGAERDIFSFERNAKTFIVCILLLWLALPLLTGLSNILNRLKKSAMDKIGRTMGRNAPQAGEVDIA